MNHLHAFTIRVMLKLSRRFSSNPLKCLPNLFALLTFCRRRIRFVKRWNGTIGYCMSWDTHYLRF